VMDLPRFYFRGLTMGWAELRSRRRPGVSAVGSVVTVLAAVLLAGAPVRAHEAQPNRGSDSGRLGATADDKVMPTSAVKSFGTTPPDEKSL
jgi:hypothetical protein